MKSICVNESSGFDQLDRVKSSRSVSAFIHVFVTVSPVLSPSCVKLSLAVNRLCLPTFSVSESTLPHGKSLSYRKGCIEVSSQDHVLFGSPIHEFLDFHQSCLEFSKFFPL